MVNNQNATEFKTTKTTTVSTVRVENRLIFTKLKLKLSLNRNLIEKLALTVCELRR